MSNKLFTFLNISPEDEAKIPQGIKDSIRLMEGIEAVYEKAVPEKKEMFARMLTVGYAEIMRGINNVRGINTEIHEKIKEAQKELPEEKHPPQGPEPQEPKEPEPKEPKPEEPENSNSIFYNPAFAVGEPVIGISAVATEGAEPYFINGFLSYNVKGTGGYTQPINGPKVPEELVSCAYKVNNAKGELTTAFLGFCLAGVGDTIAYNIKGFPAVLCEIKNIQCNEKGKFTIVYEIKGEGTFTWSEEELKRNSIEAESFYVIQRRGALGHYMPTVPPVLKNALGDLYIGENIAHITSNDIVVHERIRNGSETDTVGGLFPFRKDGPSLRNFSCYTYNSKSVYRQAAWATGDIIALSASGKGFVYIRMLQIPDNSSERLYYENMSGRIIETTFKDFNILIEGVTSAYLVQMRPESYRLFPDSKSQPQTPKPPKPEPPKPEKGNYVGDLKRHEKVMAFLYDRAIFGTILEGTETVLDADIRAKKKGLFILSGTQVTNYHVEEIGQPDNQTPLSVPIDRYNILAIGDTFCVEKRNGDIYEYTITDIVILPDKTITFHTQWVYKSKGTPDQTGVSAIFDKELLGMYEGVEAFYLLEPREWKDSQEPPKPEPPKPDSDKPDLASELKEDEEVLVLNADFPIKLKYGIATSEITYVQPDSYITVQFPLNGPSIDYDTTFISQEIGFKDEEGEVGDFEYFNRATVIAVGDILYHKGVIHETGLHINIIDINAEEDKIVFSERTLPNGKPKERFSSISFFNQIFCSSRKDKLYILKTRTQNPDWPYKAIPETKPAPKQKQKKEPKTEDLKNKVKSVNLDEFNNLLNEIEF